MDDGNQPTSGFDPIDGVIAEFLQAVEEGKNPSREQLLKRYPEYADRLRDFFANLDRMSRGASGFRLPDLAATSGDGGLSDLPRLRYLGDYELLSEIARGGMGVVFRARQVTLNRPVAVKMILAGTYATPREVQRFRAEAEAAANLDHPNILPIYEVGEFEGHQYFSMKLVEGGSLSSRLADLSGRLTDAMGLMAVLARAVHFAHQRGILHRDLKPANVLLASDGTPFITDFGLAKRVVGEDGAALTQSGSVVGTPSYMPPEQARGGKDISTSVDVYALGAILYEILAGRPPFKADSVFATLKQVIETETPDPRNFAPHADRDLCVVAMKCLRKEPASRYSSAAELADDLDRWRRGEPIHARPIGRTERTRMWVRRNPVKASAVLVAAVALVSVFASLNYALRQSRLSESATRKLYEQSVEQEQQALSFGTKIADSLAAERKAAYFARINLAFNEWQLNNPARADRLLEEAEMEPRGWEYPFLKRIMHTERHAIAADPRAVGVMAYTPDGSRLVTAGSDQNIRVWDTATGELTFVIVGHTAPLRGVVFLADGRQLLASSHKETILWSLESGKRLPWRGPTMGALQIARRPDGRLAMATADKHVAAFAADSEQPLWTAPGETVAWVNEGSAVATGVGEAIVLYDPATGQEASRLSSQGAPQVIASVSDDGRRLATHTGPLAPENGTNRITVWDVPTGKALLNLRAAGFEVQLHPDGKSLAVGGQREVRLWSVDSGEERPKLRGLPNYVQQLAFSPDGRSFAAATGDPIALASIKQNPTDQGATLMMAFMNMVMVSSAAEVRMWDLPLPDYGTPLPSQEAPVTCIATGPDNLLAVGRETALEIWDASSRKLLRSISIPSGSAGVATFSPDGSLLIVGGSDKTVRVYETATGHARSQALSQPGAINALAAFSDGNTVAVATRSIGAAVVWDYASGTETAVSFADADGSAFLAIGHRTPLIIRSNSGSMKFTNESITRQSGILTVIDSATGLRLRDFEPTLGVVRAIALSPDDRVLAVVSGDKVGGEAVQFFDVASGKETHHFPGDSEIVTSLTFTPDGNRLIVATDAALKLWDVASGKVLLSVPWATGNLAFSPDGDRLIAVRGSTIVIFDTDTPTVLRPLPQRSNQTAGGEPTLSQQAEPDPIAPGSREWLVRAEERWDEKDLAGALLYALRAAELDPAHAEHFSRSVRLYQQALPLLGAAEPSVAKTPLVPASPLNEQCESRFGPHATTLFTTLPFGGTQHRFKVVDILTAREVDSGVTPGTFFQEERNHVAPTPDGKRVFVYQIQHGKEETTRFIDCFDLASTQFVGPRITLPPWTKISYQNSATWLSATGDGRFVVLDQLQAGDDNDGQSELFSERTQVWDAMTGKELELPTPFHRLAFSPDGRFVVAAWLRSIEKEPAEAPTVVYDLTTMKPVGPPIELPDRVDFLELSSQGKFVVAREPGDSFQLRVFASDTGQCTLSTRYSDPFPHALSPDGTLVAIPGPRYKGHPVIEVREAATGKRKYTGTTLPGRPEHLQFSPDGRTLLVWSLDGTALVVDSNLVEPIGPPLAVASSHSDHQPMVPDRNVTFLDSSTIAVRALWTHENYLKQTQFHLFDLTAAPVDFADAKERAELTAGRSLTSDNELVSISGDDYRASWRRAKERHPEWFHPDAVEPVAVPRAALVNGKAPDKVARQEAKPDYGTVFRRHGGSDKPPLVSVADALSSLSPSSRMAAFNYLVFTRPENELTLDLLREGLNDDGCRNELINHIEALGAKAAPIVDGLVAELVLENGHEAVQKNLVRALGKIGPGAKDAVPVLRQFMASFGPNSYSDVEGEAIRTLGRIGPAAASTLPDLLSKAPKMMGRSNDAIYMRTLERITQNDTDALVPHLIQALENPGTPVQFGHSNREYLCNLIARLGPKARGVEATLISQLAEPKPPSGSDEEFAKARVAICEAIWRVTGDHEAVLPALTEELTRALSGWGTHELPSTGQAAELIGKIGEPAKSLLPTLEAMAAKPRNPHERVAAAEAAWRLGAGPDALVAAGIDRLQENSGYFGLPDDQLAVIRLLAEVGPAAKDAIPAMLRLAKAEADASPSQSFHITIIRVDDEDPDPNQDRQFRDAVKAALEKIDAAALQDLENLEPNPRQR
jgi:serine/threonine protein kinase/WD40 repeat protein